MLKGKSIVSFEWYWPAIVNKGIVNRNYRLGAWKFRTAPYLTVFYHSLTPLFSLSVMSTILRVALARRVHHNTRCLATASTKSAFKETLEAGPSLDDFVAGKEPERVVLGNTNG